MRCRKLGTGEKILLAFFLTFFWGGGASNFNSPFWILEYFYFFAWHFITLSRARAKRNWQIEINLASFFFPVSYVRKIGHLPAEKKEKRKEPKLRLISCEIEREREQQKGTNKRSHFLFYFLDAFFSFCDPHFPISLPLQLCRFAFLLPLVINGRVGKGKTQLPISRSSSGWFIYFFPLGFPPFLYKPCVFSHLQYWKELEKLNLAWSGKCHNFY